MTLSIVDIFFCMLPVILLLGLGMACRPLIADVSRRDLSKLLFYIFLPALLIDKLALQQPQFAHLTLTIAIGVGAVIVTSSSILVAFRRGWLRKLSGEQIAGLLPTAIRCNGAFVGLPIILMLGQHGALAPRHVDSYLIIMAALVPVIHFFGILCTLLPLSSHRDQRSAFSLARIPREIISNPVIIACLLGIGCSLIAPGALNNSLIGMPVHLLGNAAIPLALFLAGASVNFHLLRQLGRATTELLVIKLIVLPALAAAACWLLAVPTHDTAVLVILLGCPVAAGAVAVSQSLGADARTTAGAVAASTLLAPLSLSTWLWILN